MLFDLACFLSLVESSIALFLKTTHSQFHTILSKIHIYSNTKFQRDKSNSGRSLFYFFSLQKFLLIDFHQIVLWCKDNKIFSG